MDLDSLVQEKLEADTEFQTSLAELPEEERGQALEDKRKEVLANEFSTLKEQAEKAAKAEELAGNYKTRAEKAEATEKAREKADQEAKARESNPTGLTSADLLAVTNAHVHEDDIERVERFAKSEGLSIKESIKSPELRAVLDLREEQRRVADATNIGNVRAGNVKITDETLPANAERGKLTEGDLEIERLIAAKARENKG